MFWYVKNDWPHHLLSLCTKVMTSFKLHGSNQMLCKINESSYWHSVSFATTSYVIGHFSVLVAALLFGAAKDFGVFSWLTQPPILKVNKSSFVLVLAAHLMVNKNLGLISTIYELGDALLKTSWEGETMAITFIFIIPFSFSLWQ